MGEEITYENDPQLAVVVKHTNPPSRFKEASFIKELESRGIGRPSTFAYIVETLLSSSRGYCEVKDKCIVPTELGKKVSDYLTDKFPTLFSIEYTAEMEAELDQIAKGKLKSIDFLTSYYTTLEDAAGKICAAPVVTDKICPECGKPLVERMGRYGKFLGCSGYPKCTHIEKIKEPGN